MSNQQDKGGRIKSIDEGRPDTEERAAAREVAATIRALIEKFVGANTRTYMGSSESSLAGDPGAFFDHSPVAGVSNPLAPPLYLRVEGDEIVGEGRFGSAYEGAPGCVHGGFVLAAFDEVLGLAQDLGGQPGMTGTLTTKFRRPTPLHTDLRFVARIDRIEGRKTFTVGELYDPDGNLLAESDAVFITVDFTKLTAMAEIREKRPRD